MLGIEQPFKVYGKHVPYGPLSDQLPDLRMMGGSVAIVECYPDCLAILLLSVNYCLCFFAICGNGFFTDDVTTQLHRLYDVLVMGPVY